MPPFTFAVLIGINLCISFVSSGYIPPGPKYNCPVKKNLLFPCKCDKGSDVGLYVSCDGGNLASLSIAFENLASLEGSKIEEVSISNSYIAKLYGTIFHKSNTRILRIENVPIKTISGETFYWVNETLEELYIQNTSLNLFPREAFKNLGNLKILRIDQSKLPILNNNEFDDSQIAGKLEKLHLTNGEITEIGANTFQHLKKLKNLDLHGNRIAVLKKNQFRGLRDVEILDLSHNSLAKLDSTHIADLTKLGFLNASHNSLNELARGAFARNSVLKVLNLSFNNIKKLDANSFRGMRFLRRLYLSDNAIIDVGRGTFGSVSRIGTIDLARNQIKKIDYQMFAQLKYVEIIDVAENNITEIQKQSFTDLYLTSINVSYNSLSKIETNSFISCANITRLDFSHNLLENFPKQVFDENTYASDFDLSFNRLTNFSQIPLQNMTGLRVLNVSFNEITEIPRNTFPKLYELHTIDASHNMITEISNAVLMPLFSLRSLNLSHNMVEKIKPSTFGSLSTLLDLDLSNNMIKEISRGSMHKLSSLRTLNVENNFLENVFQLPISLNFLNLKNNSIREIPEKTWPVMNSLLLLDLSHNRLENNLKGDSFLSLLTLQTLNLNANGITEIPYDSLGEIKTLQYLHLEHNNITKLGKGAFGKLPVVFEVNLHGNQIFNISKKAFDGLLQLLTLNLSSNALKTIPNDAFFGLVSLRKLDLSNNFLEKLDNKTNSIFEDCLSLRKLILRNNKISFVTRKMFPSVPYVPYRLESIDLSYNLLPILTFDISFGTKKLKHLNVSHNSIQEVRKSVLGNLTELEVLDMSFNGLTDLADEENPFNLPINLTHLYLQNNKIEKIDYEKITNLTNIKEINLENNRLERLNKTMVDLIRAGVLIHFKGNPLDCDCEIRPLLHFMSASSSAPPQYGDIECAEPYNLSGKKLSEIDDNHATCTAQEIENIIEYSHEYEVLPNIRFRDILYAKGSMYIQWLISATNKDISDFYITIRNKDKVFYENSLPYDSRLANISGAILGKIDFKQDLELCVLSKNSENFVLNTFDTQCTKMPKNLNSIMTKYNKRPSSFFKIYEMDKRHMGRNALALSDASKLSFNTLLIAIFCFHAIRSY